VRLVVCSGPPCVYDNRCLFLGDTTASALTAVFTANLILVAYIIVSVQEESKAKATTIITDETKKTK